MNEVLLSVGGYLLSQVVTLLLYHYGFVRQSAPKAPAPAVPPVPPAAPKTNPDAAPGPFLASHPLLAQLASRFDAAVQQAAAQAAAGLIPAILQGPPAPRTP